MKKLLGILVLGFLWCSSVYAAKDDGICGLQSQLSDLTDASMSIKIAVLVKVKNTDKENCKKILGVLTEAQKKYALADVTHLRDIYEFLSQKLEKTGRLKWVEEEIKILISPETYDFDPRNSWRRIK